MGAPNSKPELLIHDLCVEEQTTATNSRHQEFSEFSKSKNHILNYLFDTKPFKSLEKDLPPLDMSLQLEGVMAKEAIQMSDGSIYKGEWNEEGQKHGRGIEIKKNGSKYQGYYQHNLPNGFGRFTIPDCQTYQGEFSNGKAHGKGYLKTAKGFSYMGEWKTDLQHGKGKEIHPDGMEYDGDFCEGKKQGFGKLEWPDGNSYEGEFFNDDLHGRGVYKWGYNKVYNGEWVLGQMKGYGECRWKDGTLYKGNFDNDNQEGYGVMKWPNGKLYDGEWKNGKKHGKGILKIQTEGQIVVKKGIWVDGKRQHVNN